MTRIIVLAVAGSNLGWMIGVFLFESWRFPCWPTENANEIGVLLCPAGGALLGIIFGLASLFARSRFPAETRHRLS